MFIATSVFISQARAAEDFGLGLFNTPALFEKNAFQPAFDIWVNQTSTSPSLQMKYSLTEITQGWALRRYLFATPIDSANDIFTNLAPDIIVLRSNNLLMTQSEDYNPSGYETFSDRDTNIEVNFDQMDLGKENVGTTMDLNADYLAATTYPTQNNYTTIESSPLPASVTYEAGDGKSINDYAKDAAESQNEVFIETHNCTALGFGFDQHDGLINVASCFDEELITSAFVKGQMTFQSSTLVRHRVWMHQREVDQKWSGWDASTKHTEFKPISQASGTLAGIPTGAQCFYAKTVGSAYWGPIAAAMPKIMLADGSEVELDAIDPAEDSYTIQATMTKWQMMCLMYKFKTVILGLLIFTPILIVGLVILYILGRAGKLKKPGKK